MDTTPREKKVIKTNRGNTITMTVHYAKETPEGFWEEVCTALEYCGVFDDLKK